MNPAAPSRVRSVDCAKCLAIFCVLLIHAASDVLRGGPISSIRWLSGLFWGSVSRGAVPLFLLCSGALLLDAERTISARHIWRRNIPHMLFALFFWAAVYKAIGLLTAGQTDAAALRGAVRDWLLWQHEGHLYYLPVILLVYAALPLTRTFTAHADAKTMRYFLAFWFAFGVLLPTLRQLGLLQDFGGIVRQWPLPMVWSAIGCTVLGDALRRRPLTARCAGLLFAAGFLLCFAGTWLLSAKAGGAENAVSGGLLARPLPDGRRAVLPLHAAAAAASAGGAPLPRVVLHLPRPHRRPPPARRAGSAREPLCHAFHPSGRRSLRRNQLFHLPPTLQAPVDQALAHLNQAAICPSLQSCSRYARITSRQRRSTG